MWVMRASVLQVLPGERAGQQRKIERSHVLDARTVGDPLFTDVCECPRDSWSVRMSACASLTAGWRLFLGHWYLVTILRASGI